MRIKKLTAVMLSAVMAISMCACTAKDDSAEVKKEPYNEATYLDNATKEVTGNLTKLAQDEAYLRIYTYQDDATEMAKACGELTPDFTEGVYEISGGADMMGTVLKALDEDDELNGLGEFSRDYLNGRFSGNLASYVNGRRGVDYVVISSALNYSRTYVPEEPVSDRIRIIPTEDDGTYFFVSFTNTGDGALTVSTTYLFSGGNLEDEFKELFGITLNKLDK